MVFLYPNKFVTDPNSEDVFEIDLDNPDHLSKLLDEPEAIAEDDEDGKEQANAVCGARYFPSVDSRDREGVDCVETVVLDVDCSNTPSGSVPDEATLRNALEGTRAVVYTSPSHTVVQPRWRVLLPLKSALPPKKHRALVSELSKVLVPGFEGCIDTQSTGDPCRLGFVSVTKHPEDYRWFSVPGERLDWTAFQLDDEEWISTPLSGLDRSSLWTDRQQGLRDATKHFSMAGQGLKAGDGRSVVIWKAANALWWEWAAEDEAFVLEVLERVNENFADPEVPEELQRQMHEAHKRTIGERRRGQSNGAYGWRREPNNVVSKSSLIAYAKRLKQRRNAMQVEVGEAIYRAVKKGQPVSDDPQTWRGLLTKVAHELAKVYPNEDGARVADFFRPGLAAMKANSALAPSLEEFAVWVDSKVASGRKQREERQERQDAVTRDIIESVTGGERDTKYTKQEVEAWENVGLRHNTWLLVDKSSVFVFVNGTWKGPYTTQLEFDAQVYKDLTPASDVGVRIKTYSEKKEAFVKIPISELIDMYGLKINTRIDMNCDKTWFDVSENVLVLAGPPKRKLEARFHDEVDQWLRVMTGRDHKEPLKDRQAEAATVGKIEDEDVFDLLNNWLACLTMMDKPCAALYLEGAPSVGKGLFAEGIARLWKGGAVSLEHANGNFNSLLNQTPLVWVDEALHESIKASTLLRKFLANREFVINEKYENAVKSIGCIRLVFTANNLELFNKSKENLKRDDVKALKQRFVYFRVRDKAADFLESISPRHEAFVERNMLAEHALWLHEKRGSDIVRRRLRFLVKGRASKAGVGADDIDVADVVATNNDVASECCNAICEAVLSGKKPSWMDVRNGLIYVQAIDLHKHFVVLMNPVCGRSPLRDVVRAVSSISVGDPNGKTIKHHQTKKTVRMRTIEADTIRAWCRNTGIHVWEDVKEAVIAMNTVTHASGTDVADGDDVDVDVDDSDPKEVH